jgi:hypothetical protein
MTMGAASKPKFTPRFGYHLLIGTLAALALEGLIYLAVLDNTVGRFSLFSNAGASARHSLKVAILRSQATASFYGEHPEAYFDISRQWETVLREAAISHQVISEAELPRTLRDGTTVLVLPAFTCAGNPERDLIRQFLAAGNGVVVSGAPGRGGTPRRAHPPRARPIPRGARGPWPAHGVVAPAYLWYHVGAYGGSH